MMAKNMCELVLSSSSGKPWVRPVNSPVAVAGAKADTRGRQAQRFTGIATYEPSL